jgi:hypothetical protein
MEPVPIQPTVTYWATSLFSSRTFWFNAAAMIVAVLSATEVIKIIPPRFGPFFDALVAVINIALRVATVRPVAFIAPGNTLPIVVAKIDPPAPPVLTD